VRVEAGQLGHRRRFDVVLFDWQKMRCGRGVLCCPGLHPSQQLTKYDGEVVPASTQNGTAQRLSSLGSADDQHAGVPETDGAIPPVEAQAPVQDVSDLYTLPVRVVSRRQAEGESAASDETASYQYGGPYLQDSNDRKSSLTGDRHIVISDNIFVIISS